MLGPGPKLSCLSSLPRWWSSELLFPSMLFEKLMQQGLRTWVEYDGNAYLYTVTLCLPRVIGECGVSYFEFCGWSLHRPAKAWELIKYYTPVIQASCPWQALLKKGWGSISFCWLCLLLRLIVHCHSSGVSTLQNFPEYKPHKPSKKAVSASQLLTWFVVLPPQRASFRCCGAGQLGTSYRDMIQTSSFCVTQDVLHINILGFCSKTLFSKNPPRYFMS